MSSTEMQENFETAGNGLSAPKPRGPVVNIQPAIEFREVELAFDDQVILDNVSFTVRKGETKIVLGGSGTGKSTIINLVLGLLKPDAGQILVDGEDITEFDDQQLMRI